MSPQEAWIKTVPCDFFACFEELNRLGAAVIVATHDATLVKQYAYDVLHLHKGTLRLQSS